MTTFEREREAACALARHAGQLILEFYALPAEKLHYKGFDDPQTAADRVANRYLVEELQRRFPGDGILAEESADVLRDASAERVWVVDPLDGTKEFLEQNGQFVVQVGLVVAGRPLVGAVYQPTEDRLYFGVVGAGAWIQKGDQVRPLRTSQKNDPTEMIAVLSRSHRADLADAMTAALGVRAVLRIGSAGLKMGAIAERRADLYLHPSRHTKLWDSAAPEAVLVAAGGAVSDFLGRPLDYSGREVRNLGGLVASNGPAHDRILEVVGPLWEAVAD
ncbi:MAG: 3'(2'),5'-bisphosphate nucleotidase CysQ [Ardenticatenaceae bacterium]|nr:3'(2'),5'-bisphosphate nucleotidase CysQ [Ardenticatenaceae bacterium]HBY96706.1 3'(2'),5'-bisphosphate nucleotidase CysQ [Chloroflexota bacterium]